MADKAVARITIEFNGVIFEDFNDFTEGDRVLSKQVNFMNKTGFASMLQRHTFSVTRVRIIGPQAVDFDGLENGTSTVEYEGGERVTFSGVHTISVGSESATGEDEMTSTIDFGASVRITN